MLFNEYEDFIYWQKEQRQRMKEEAEEEHESDLHMSRLEDEAIYDKYSI